MLSAQRVEKFHHAPLLASVVPFAFRALTCQKYRWRAARPPTETVVAVVAVHDEQEPLVVDTHHSYEVAPELDPQLRATGLDRFFCPFVGESFANAPGGVAPAWVVNDHQLPPSPKVSPAVFVARSCQ